MRVIICDRCGKQMNQEDVKKTMTISRIRKNGDGDTERISLIHCDRLKLMSSGEIQMDFEIDLCDACKTSFVTWYGKVGIYER